MTPGIWSRYAPYLESSPDGVHRAREQLGVDLRPARPPPYSSAWISTIAAFGAPHSRGSAHECGSASLSWYAERWIMNSAICAAVASRSMYVETDGRVVGDHQLAQRASISSGAGGSPGGADELQQLGLEAALELGAQREQRRLPLPPVVDAVEAAVVQLVAAVQREVQILVVDARRQGTASRWGGSRSAATSASLTGPRGSGSVGIARVLTQAARGD